MARSSDGHALTVQATLSTTRILDRRGVRALLDIIASSSEFRREMHNALAVYDVGQQPPSSRATCIASTADYWLVLTCGRGRRRRARLSARSVAHPFQLLRLEEVSSQAVELDVEGDTAPLDDLALAAAHVRAAADHPDSRTRSEGSHQTDV